MGKVIEKVRITNLFEPAKICPKRKSTEKLIAPVLLLNKKFIGVTHDTVPWFLERFAQAYLDQVRDFVEAVYQDREPKVTAHDGKAALKVVLAAIRSCREGKPIWL